MKIYLLGEESINNELKTLFTGKVEIADELNNSIDIIVDSTNFPKQKKFEDIKFIDENCSKSVPVISSSLCHSISEQSSVSKFPERLIGIGLYNTFSKSSLLEIAPSKITDGKILKNTESFLKSANINYTIVPDRVGLVFPRILSMIINEAAQVYAEKIAQLEDIDTAMKLGTNYPYGPLEWADKIGVKLIYNILESLQKDFGEERYRPHSLLKEIVNNKKRFYQVD